MNDEWKIALRTAKKQMHKHGLKFYPGDSYQPTGAQGDSAGEKH